MAPITAKIVGSSKIFMHSTANSSNCSSAMRPFKVQVFSTYHHFTEFSFRRFPLQSKQFLIGFVRGKPVLYLDDASKAIING